MAQSYKVKRLFKDTDKQYYGKDQLYTNTSQARIDELIDKGFLVAAEEETEAELKHLGGGHYELPNGEKVRGKDKAIAALNDQS
ncbi:hypothetical protein [Jeotgalibacillus salarius]|uniref:Uncharacterized protein n=1 Tax=Jeotgalibacillus salarius TaxID=546023 RepID=A0A4Y8LIM8_9BACL|nr:hypothetical protein [Jeotgalibacillus salarius]TFE02884.1 hypothetical protein E2626_03505 [Jeotgalibacillus salarius]